MANEAVVLELFNGGRPIQYNCADGATIEKGTLLELTPTADRTVIANTNDNYPVVGIAAHEKVSGDGATTITAWTDGIFDMLTDGGNDNAGVVMANSATENTIQTADAADLLQGSKVGYLLEDITGAEVAAVRINK